MKYPMALPLRYPIFASRQLTPVRDAVHFIRWDEFHFYLVKYVLMAGLILGSLTELFSQANTVTTTYTTKKSRDWGLRGWRGGRGRK
jgi:hypothetical protein